jgi:8-hydroxy-5-deazaflavin:NADPH oxidoreductase
MEGDPRVDIGIIGVGMIGGTIARLLAERGHQVRVSTRSPDDPRLAAMPPRVGRTTPEGAARFGVATIVAVPFSALPELARSLGAAVDGRVILDTSNAIPGRDGPAAEDALSSGEGSGVAVARLLRGARVVKAFSSVHFATLARTAGAEPPIAIPLAGDDPGAVAIAAGIVAAAGFAPVPAGALREAAHFDFGTALFNVAMTEAELRVALSLGH